MRLGKKRYARCPMRFALRKEVKRDETGERERLEVEGNGKREIH